MVFTRKMSLQTKVSGSWKDVTAPWVKLPTTTTTTVNPGVPSETVALTTVGGPQTWVIPNNVSKIKVEIIGGGGGGGRGCELDPYVSGGGGGGSGGFNVVELDVTPGTSLQYYVGAGGAGIGARTSSDGGGGTGTAGESSWFISDTSYVATGGGAARNSSSNHYELGGLGGLPNGVNGSNGVKINSDDGGPTAGGAGGGILGRSTGGAGASATTGESGSPGSGYGAGGGGGAGKGGGTVTQGGGAAGKPGAILISYGVAPTTVTTTTGGWKEVSQIYVKVSGAWKALMTNTAPAPRTGQPDNGWPIA